MSAESNVDQDGNLISELNVQIQLLKEEIRTTFMRHRKTLASRELWLLDQADSIKDISVSMILERQMSLADAKTKIDQCAEFLRFCENAALPKGIEYASSLITKLKKQTEEASSDKELPLPEIRFVHDRKQLRNSILRYGALETSLNRSDDVGSENSWDLIEEKGEDCSEKTECLARIPCKQIEIEDMDFVCVSEATDTSSHILDLGKVCKANEICESITDCVCDVPCHLPTSSTSCCAQPTTRNPVVELSNNLSRIFHEGNHTGVVDMVGKNGGCKMETEFLDIVDDNSVSFSSCPKNVVQSGIPEKPSFCVSADDGSILDLNLKLQSIFDGDKNHLITPDVKAESTKLADESDFDSTSDPQFTFTSIEKMHGKIQGIFDGNLQPSEPTHIEKSVDLRMISSKTEREGLITSLHSRLQSIIDGVDASDHPCCGSESAKMSPHTLPMTQKHQLSGDKHGFIDTLHCRLQGILDGTIDVNKEQDHGLGQTSAGLHCEKSDAVMELKMRLEKISPTLED